MTVIHAKRKANTAAQATEELVDVGIRYSCDHCYRDISAIPRIQCAECGIIDSPPPSGKEKEESSGNKTLVVASSEEVDLCVECFGKGIEFGQHKRNHAYRVIRPLDFPLYEDAWRADEELLLLEAVESNGMGNWLEISDQVGSKTPDECEQHYRRLYLDWEGRPLPVLYNVFFRISYLSVFSDKNPKYEAKSEKAKRRKELVSLEEMLPKKRVKREASVDHGAGGTPFALQSQPANHEITGYMPGRLEFETEFENEAETLVKDIVFNDEDTPFDIQLKLSILDIYSGILDRRKARRDFVHQHGLIDFKRFTATDKARSREERELFNHLKPFARLIPVGDFQQLLDGLVKEEELRRRIAQLQEYRKNGLRSLEQVSTYEAEKKHLELYLKGGSLPTSSAGTSTSSSKIVLAREPFPLPHPSNLQQPIRPSNQLIFNIPDFMGNTTSTSSQSTASHQNILNNRKASMPLNISHADGIELLSEKEREICSILRLYPRLYLNIKDTLIRECLRLGGLKRAQARSSVKIDVNKTSKLYDFFITAGWIKPPASGE